MAWESRKNGKYFYVSVRSRTKVRKSYFGRGPHADIAAATMEMARQQLRQAAEAARAERAQFQEADRLVDDFHVQSGCWLAAELIIRGYHQHARGPWRKRHAVGPVPFQA